MARKSYSDKEREQVKEALLITVLESIVNQGLVHSSIAILCEKVGISKTFFYSFFSSKEELVMQALRYQQPKLLRYDNIWGIRLSANSLEAQDPMKWRGQNLLGFALMEVRDELRRVTQNEMLCDWNAV